MAMVKDDDADNSCPAVECVILRGSDGRVYQVTIDALQTYRVDRDDEHMRAVRAELDKLPSNWANMQCIQGRVELMMKNPCCARALLQIREITGKSS
jgi:transposase